MVVDPAATTVTCSGALRYGELARALDAEGLALHNLASLTHISLAGAIATATHGSGDASGNLATAIRPVLQVSELRTVAADRLWMSPQHEQDTLGIHFTWEREPAAVDRVLHDIEAALAPLGARPHWGKWFLTPPGGRYPRRAGFAALAERLDARGAFHNAWLETHVLAA